MSAGQEASRSAAALAEADFSASKTAFCCLVATRPRRCGCSGAWGSKEKCYVDIVGSYLRRDRATLSLVVYTFSLAPT
jgi:hypothetical protein